MTSNNNGKTLRLIMFRCIARWLVQTILQANVRAVN